MEGKIQFTYLALYYRLTFKIVAPYLRNLRNLRNPRFRLFKFMAKIYYFCPIINEPSGGIGVLLKQATILQEANYEVHIIYHPKPVRQETNGQLVYEEFKPEWLEFSLEQLKFIPIGEELILTNKGNILQCQRPVVTPEDLLIIPEQEGDCIVSTQHFPGKRVVLAQNWAFILPTLKDGQQWQDLGITQVISVSDAITEFLNSYMPGLTVYQYSPSIDSNNLFTPPAQEKTLGICFMARRGFENEIKTWNVLRLFKLRYPQYKEIPLVELKDLTRRQFAQTLAKYSVALFIDEIAGWGTLPLEAMACHTHVVGFRSYGSKEYITEENGFWVTSGDVFALADKLGEVVDKVAKQELDEAKLFKHYQQTLARYTEEKERQRVLEIFDRLCRE